MPTALVITAAGINCDRELAEAFELAGARAELVHLNRLVARPQLVDRYDLVGLPGGFSYGDTVAAGRIMAALMRRHLYPALVHALQRGAPMIAPCNGFQIAAQIGLLPGPPVGGAWPAAPAPPGFALTANASGRFVDRWCRVEVPADTRCVWTAGLEPPDGADLLPVAHAEGRVTFADDSVPARLAESGQMAVRYAAADNPNGSALDIAGICDVSGLLLGLMPHPERYTRWTQHPSWTRRPDLARGGDPPGLAMFRRAVAHVRTAGVESGN